MKRREIAVVNKMPLDPTLGTGNTGYLSQPARLILLVAVALIAACSGIAYHDEEGAAREALLFGKTAFIDGNDSQAYSMLSGKLKAQLSQSAFKQLLASMHPLQHPRTLSAREYEVFGASSVLNVLLYGDAPNEHFYYRLAMEGGAVTGYRVAGLWRSEKPFQPTGMREVLRRQPATGS